MLHCMQEEWSLQPKHLGRPGIVRPQEDARRKVFKEQYWPDILACVKVSSEPVGTTGSIPLEDKSKDH